MIDPPFAVPVLRTLPSGVAEDVAQAANNCGSTALSYLSTGWPGTGPVTSWGGDLEANIRPPACNAFGLAVLISHGLYDAVTVGQGVTAAKAAVVRYVDGLARTHTANGGTWGGDAATYDGYNYRGWQSAMWAAFTAHAAALLWAELSSTQRGQVQAMIGAEADRFVGFPIPSMRDRSGRVVYRGDTKAEEIAWNAYALYLAAAILPADQRATGWRATAIDMSIAALATPSDISSTTMLHGRRVRDVVTGSNLDLGGIVENHGYVFPAYSTSAALNQFHAVAFAAISGGPVPAAALHNADWLYHAMTDTQFRAPPHNSPGGTVYQPGSAGIYYPASDEGDPDRMACYVAMDTLAHCLGTDTRSTVPAATWTERHTTQQLTLQAASPGARRGYWDLSHLAAALHAHHTIASRPGLVVDNT